MVSENSTAVFPNFSLPVPSFDTLTGSYSRTFSKAPKGEEDNLLT